MLPPRIQAPISTGSVTFENHRLCSQNKLIDAELLQTPLKKISLDPQQSTREHIHTAKLRGKTTAAVDRKKKETRTRTRKPTKSLTTFAWKSPQNSPRWDTSFACQYHLRPGQCLRHPPLKILSWMLRSCRPP